MSKKSAKAKAYQDETLQNWTKTMGNIQEIMNMAGIKQADIARALDKKPRTVNAWFEDPGRSLKHMREIVMGLNIALEARGEPAAIDLSILDPIIYQRYTYDIRQAARKSLNETMRWLNTEEYVTLANIAYNMFYGDFKYPGFYEAGPWSDVCVDKSSEDNQSREDKHQWTDDDALFRTPLAWDSIKNLHSKAEALANGTAETSDSDPYAGRWDFWEQSREEKAKEARAEAWTKWLKSRPADIPAPPELLQLLGILAMEGVKFDTGFTFRGNYTIGNEQTK